MRKLTLDEQADIVSAAQGDAYADLGIDCLPYPDRQKMALLRASIIYHFVLRLHNHDITEVTTEGLAMAMDYGSTTGASTIKTYIDAIVPISWERTLK